MGSDFWSGDHLPLGSFASLFTLHIEGPEEVKWGLGFAHFCTGKIGFGLLGLGITNTKLGMGNVYRKYTAYVINAQ